MTMEIPVFEKWREEAISEALRVEADSGESVDILLREIRRNRPGCATLRLWPDRLQLLHYLETATQNFRHLITGQDGHIERDTVCPYFGWYAVEWQGVTFEIVLAPGTYVSANILLVADTMPELQTFYEALEEYHHSPVRTLPALFAALGKFAGTGRGNRQSDVGGCDSRACRHRARPGSGGGILSASGSVFRPGFPWRRGVLLIGPPGTGKTMLCKAAAAALPDLPFLYVRDFQTDSDHEDAITDIFARARKLAPCLLAFEDIDGLVNELNRTVFLNELDGFQNNEGLLIIASSNHPDRIDEALLKRPSRFDRVLHIGLPALAERRAYCLNLLSRSSLSARLSPDFDASELAQRVAEKSNGFTPAYLKEAFIAAALAQAQAGVMTLDSRFAASVLTQVEELRRHLRKMRDPDTLRDFSSPDAEPMGIRRNRA